MDILSSLHSLSSVNSCLDKGEGFDFLFCLSYSKTTGANLTFKNHRQQWHRVTKETQWLSAIPVRGQEGDRCASSHQKVGGEVLEVNSEAVPSQSLP